jgi:hypothetical protein
MEETRCLHVGPEASSEEREHKEIAGGEAEILPQGSIIPKPPPGAGGPLSRRRMVA